MTAAQRVILEQEYECDPNWSRQKTAEIAIKLGVKREKVYKWHWDRRNKERFDEVQQ